MYVISVIMYAQSEVSKLLFGTLGCKDEGELHYFYTIFSNVLDYTCQDEINDTDSDKVHAMASHKFKKKVQFCTLQNIALGAPFWSQLCPLRSLLHL